YSLEGEVVKVKDLYFENNDSLQKILYFISSFKGYYKNLKIESFIGQELESYLPNRKDIIVRKIPFIMTKIIDIKSTLKVFFESYNLPELNLKIYDSYIDNLQCLSWREGEIIEEERENGFDIEIDMESLTSFLYGGIKIETLKKQKKIKIEKWIELRLLQISEDKISYIHEYV
ncbi:MAG: hypothetical protein ACRC40_00700, partial [Fusobacteriaceae bacterium]